MQIIVSVIFGKYYSDDTDKNKWQAYNHFYVRQHTDARY